MNMLRRSVGRDVRSRVVLYAEVYAVLLAVLLEFTMVSGDDRMDAGRLYNYSTASL